MKIFNAVAAIAVLFLCVSNAVAQGVLPSRVLGDIEVVLLCDEQGVGDRSILLGATDRIMSIYAPKGVFFNACNAFLIRMPAGNVLIDAGYGKKLLENLAAAKVKPDQISTILLTHMHGDHIGGLVKGGKAVFAKADLYIPKPEYDYWAATNNAKAQEVLKLYADRIKLFDPANFTDVRLNELLPGIRPIAAYGHTPGHTMYLLRSEDGASSMLVWGDIMHAVAIQMPHPEVAVRYDMDAGMAVKSRNETLEYITKNRIPIAGMHIPYPGMGTVEKGLQDHSGGRFIFLPYNVN